MVRPALVMLLATGFLIINHTQGGDVSLRDLVLSALSGMIITLIMGIKPR